MKMFTFTSPRQNYGHGDYDFAAETYEDAVRMALLFEKEFNSKIAANDNYTIKFDLKVRVTDVTPGFIDIRGRDHKKSLAKAQKRQHGK